MARETRHTFCGVPVSVLKVKGGWQVQRRAEDAQGELTGPWQDVPDGLFSTAETALDQAPVLCEF
jgi:hypothetical protein